MGRRLWLLLFFGAMPPGWAGEAVIVEVMFQQRGNLWDVRVTLDHGDEGWTHYVDAWRLRAVDGTVLVEQVMPRPHRGGRLFSRRLRGLRLPRGLRHLWVEARDSRLGWSPRRVWVDLRQAGGPRYRVRLAGVR